MLIDNTATAQPPRPRNPRECHLYLAEGCHLYIALTQISRVTRITETPQSRGEMFAVLAKMKHGDSLHREGRRPGTMAGRFAGTGIPAVKSFPHRAPSSVIGEERFGSRYDMEPAAQHGSSPDSPLQGAGFEPPVPRRAARRCSARKRRQCEVARTSPPSRHDYRASRSRASWVTTDARATRRRDQ